MLMSGENHQKRKTMSVYSYYISVGTNIANHIRFCGNLINTGYDANQDIVHCHDTHAVINSTYQSTCKHGYLHCY